MVGVPLLLALGAADVPPTIGRGNELGTNLNKGSPGAEDLGGASNMHWFTSLDKLVQGALIGAAATLTGIIIKDLIIAAWASRRDRRSASTAVYRRYADPLSASLESLLWRLREVVEDPLRAAFLRRDAPGNPYNDYKRSSTLYRVSSVLGWLRAIRREQAYLRAIDRRRAREVEHAIGLFEGALADGTAVEVARLRGLCNIWSLDLPGDKAEQSRLGIVLEHEMDRVQGEWKLESLRDASSEQRLSLATSLCHLLCRELKAQALSEARLREAIERAHAVVCFREAWIFRDWQAAIGDLMLESVTGGVRRFDVVGFRRFEQMLVDGSEEEKRWISRLMDVFDDVDMTLRQSSDARVEQLKRTYRATGALLLALARSAPGVTLSRPTAELAEGIVRRFSDGK